MKLLNVKVGMGLLSVTTIFSGITPIMAATTNVYVVDHYKGDDTEIYFPNETITYNKNGLISKMKLKAIYEPDEIREDYTYNFNTTSLFTYKKNKLSKLSVKDVISTETYKPVYKGGLLKTLKITSQYSDSTSHSTRKYTYSKGRIATVNGEQYTYKNGLLVDLGDDINKYGYDSKGYLSYRSHILVGEAYDDVYFKNTYNKKGLLVSTRISKYENSDEAVPSKPVLKVTYKKIKVSKSMVKKVNAQQNWILRNVRDDSIYNI